MKGKITVVEKERKQFILILCTELKFLIVLFCIKKANGFAFSTTSRHEIYICYLFQALFILK